MYFIASTQSRNWSSRCERSRDARERRKHRSSTVRAGQSYNFVERPTDCAARIFVWDFGLTRDGMNGFVMRERDGEFFTVNSRKNIVDEFF